MNNERILSRLKEHDGLFELAINHGYLPQGSSMHVADLNNIHNEAYGAFENLKTCCSGNSFMFIKKMHNLYIDLLEWEENGNKNKIAIDTVASENVTANVGTNIEGDGMADNEARPDNTQRRKQIRRRK